MNLNDLKAQAAAQKTEVDSIVALCENLGAQLQTAINNLNQAGADTAEIQEISDILTGNTKEIADEVLKNTPSAGQVPSAPPAPVDTAPAPVTDPAADVPPPTPAPDATPPPTT